MPGKLFTGPVYDRGRPLSELAQVREWWGARRWYFNNGVGCIAIIPCTVMIMYGVISELPGGVPTGIPDPTIWFLLAVIVLGPLR